MPELAQQLTEACGPGMPGPYGELKEIGAAAAGIPPALRRHLPLTREAGGAEGSRPLPTNGRFNGSRRKACGPGMPGPYGQLKEIWAAVVQESLRRCGATSL